MRKAVSYPKANTQKDDCRLEVAPLEWRLVLLPEGGFLWMMDELKKGIIVGEAIPPTVPRLSFGV